MGSCPCAKGDNGYWSLKCVVGSCTRCLKKNVEPIANLDEKVLVSYHQFVVREVEYLSTKTNEMKVSKRTIREEEKKDVVTAYEYLKKRSAEYLKHRFQIQNDHLHWKNILATTEGVIFHMDYSENVSGSPKYEPQDAHFSEAQFSLHCTVAHLEDEKNEYLYHLSDNRTHDHKFTSTVVNDLVEYYPDVETYRFKTDNCAAQYKCKNVFPLYRNLAMSKKKTIITYYGVKGHGKGLVDAMSGFGLKTPLRKAIVTENVFYDTALTVYNYFNEKEQEGSSEKIYRLLDDIKETNDEQIPIRGIRKCHMVSYFQTGEIQTKEEICSCLKCLTGNFTACDDNTTGAKGILILEGNDENSSDSDDDEDEDSSEDKDEEDESDEEDAALSDMEEEEIFRHTDFTGMIEKGSFIAIYSSETSVEGFYICQVMDIKHSTENINDGQHFLPADTAYMECMYLEKGRENFKRGIVQYSFAKQSEAVYVTYNQVFYPMIIVSPDLTISLTDYLCISEAALSITLKRKIVLPVFFYAITVLFVNMHNIWVVNNINN